MTPQTMTPYMKGHKLPLTEWALAVYWKEAVRTLYPDAQRMADEMYKEYVRDFVDQVPDLLKESRRLNKGYNPPRSSSPIWWSYWERVSPMSNPLAAKNREPHIQAWFGGNPIVDEIVALELLMGGLVAAGSLNQRQVRRMRKPMAVAVAGLTNLPADLILEVSQGMRAAQEVLTQRIGGYHLVQEKRLMNSALVFAARYSLGPSDGRRTWDDALSRLVRDHSDLLKRLGIPEGYNRPSEARKAAMPFIETFIDKIGEHDPTEDNSVKMEQFQNT